MEQKENIDDIILLYQQKLIEELGLNRLSDVDREKVELNIADLVNKRVTNVILAYLPEEKTGDLKSLVEAGKADEIVELLRNSIPDIDIKITNDLMLLRKELISKLAKK